MVSHHCEQTSPCWFHHLLFASLLQPQVLNWSNPDFHILDVRGLWVFTYRESLVGAILKTEQGRNRRNSALPWDTRDTGGVVLSMGGGGLTELETQIYKAKYFTKIHKTKRWQMPGDTSWSNRVLYRMWDWVTFPNPYIYVLQRFGSWNSNMGKRLMSAKIRVQKSFLVNCDSAFSLNWLQGWEDDSW